jgi:type I restriction enzyme R subunit
MTDNLSAGAQYHVMVDSGAYTVMSEFTPTSSNATSYQSEAALVAEFIRILTSRGYDYLAMDSEQALIDNLRAQIETLNHMTFSDKEWKKLERMYLIRPGETIEFDSPQGILKKTGP